MKYIFTFMEINYGSIEIESDREPDDGDVIDAIMNDGAYYDNTEYENIALVSEKALDISVDGKGGKETVQGYEILRSVTFENNQGFALAWNPDVPDSFATWQFTEDENGDRDYYWGRYTSNKEAVTRTYENRIAVFFHDYGFTEKDAYKYYSTQRPVDIATYPKTEYGPIRFENFDKREPVEQGLFKAWGYLVYDAPLTAKQMVDYELLPAPNNSDFVAEKKEPTKADLRQMAKVRAAEAQEEQKLFEDYCLNNAPYSPEVKREMTVLAQLVGHWEEWKCLPDNERYTWHKPSIHAFALREPVVDPKLLDKRYYQAVDELNRAEKQTTKKPIAVQLAEAEKLVERDKGNKTDKKNNREER